jgi:hypothetical protein
MDFPIYVHDDNGFNCNIASEFSVNYTKNDVLDNTTFFKWIGLSNTSFFWSFTEKVLHFLTISKKNPRNHCVTF